jgi:hypothetical protein
LMWSQTNQHCKPPILVLDDLPLTQYDGSYAWVSYLQGSCRCLRRVFS